MDLDHIKALLNLVREHELTELEIEHDGLRLKVRKDAAGGSLVAPTRSAAVTVPVATPQPAAESEPDEEIELAVVKSPIVGTFYRSPEPGAPSFVDIGSAVKKGQILCIIEAMKLMNEIDSEYEGELVRIYVENGQSVQYGERLFAIKTQ